jgi:penicillin-insensitive murein endopeptidase
MSPTPPFSPPAPAHRTGVAVARTHYANLPQSGIGYYRYSASERQYGTQQTVHTLVTLARLWVSFTIGDTASYPFGIGDMSFRDGRHMPPHKSHTDGKCADLRPVRKDRHHAPVSIHDPQYDREETERLVNLLRSNPNVGTILFNDTSIVGVRHWPGHNNHLHVHLKH